MITEFVKHEQHIRGYSDCTAKAYEKDLRKFVAFAKRNLEHKRWSEINQEDVETFIAWEVEEGLKPTTTNRHISAIASYYNWMKSKGYQVENPCRYMSRRKIGDRIPRTAPKELIKSVMENSTGTVHLIFEVLVYTGCRIQECLDIRRGDLDIMNNIIKIHGKGANERNVYVPAETMKSLQAFSTNRRYDEKVFQTWTQREVRSAIANILRPVGTAAYMSPHDVRHAFALELAKEGYNASVIQKALGHNSIKTTQKYIDLAQLEVKNAFESLHKGVS